MTEPTNNEVHDPAEDYKVEDVPTNHDDTDVSTAAANDTQDGKGDNEPPASDFQGYSDPTADKENQS